MIADDKLQEILKLAVSATPGPWRASRERPLPGQQTRRINAPGFVVADVTIASFDHVLACSPDVIAELVTELLEARAFRKSIAEEYADWNGVDDHQLASAVGAELGFET